jgi:beta-lactamase class A
MSYNSLGGARNLVSPDFSAYGLKKLFSWKLVFALMAIFGVVGVTTALSKTPAVADQPNFSIQKSAVINQPPLATKPIVPATIQTPDKSPYLYKELESWRKKQSGSEWGFYVQSLDGKSIKVGVNQQATFTMASIYKLFLLKPLAQQVPVEAWQNKTIIGRSYQTCVEIMLSLSDNPCAESFGNTIGWSVAQRSIHTDGYDSTVINDQDNFVTSAADTALLLKRLYLGDGYNTKTKAIALQAMVSPKSVEGIRQACPGCTVYNKTGHILDVKHDAAIIEKDGRHYVVVILSRNGSWPKLTEAASIVTDSL